MIEPPTPTVGGVGGRRRLADRVFQAALLFNATLTVLWLFTVATGRPTMFFRDYTVDVRAVLNVLAGILIFYVIWGALWWAIKAQLLRRFVGFTRDEVRDAFSSRMDRVFDVSTYTSRYSERRIRIVDMIGRRGRFITLASAGFFYLYWQIAHEQQTDRATLGFLQDNLLDGLLTNWIFLAFYYRNDLLAAMFYGPQSRVMDGVLARANCVLITSLWTAFKFVMVPIGGRMSGLFTVEELPAVFTFIWGLYIAADAFSEIVGSLLGRQTLRVWGVGDVNRKSVAGVVGGFAAALALCLAVVWIHRLGSPWVVLAFIISASNITLELYSPRGTDDFTMATSNALICLAFGTIRSA